MLDLHNKKLQQIQSSLANLDDHEKVILRELLKGKTHKDSLDLLTKYPSVGSLFGLVVPQKKR